LGLERLFDRLNHNLIFSEYAMHDRLQLALDALGYETVEDLRYKSNLIHAIQVFALVKGDEDMEAACDTELEKIRREVSRRQVSK
jgi:hypothetical protein